MTHASRLLLTCWPFLLGTAFFCASASARSEIVEGPVMAEVLSVVDGDTLMVRARVWPGHSVRVRVRLRGIDAPEMRARCPAEREAAIRARDALSAMVDAGPVAVSRIGGGKFYGRILADVASAAAGDVATRLLKGGLVRAYDGGRRASWCD